MMARRLKTWFAWDARLAGEPLDALVTAASFPSTHILLTNFPVARVAITLVLTTILILGVATTLLVRRGAMTLLVVGAALLVTLLAMALVVILVAPCLLIAVALIVITMARITPIVFTLISPRLKFGVLTEI
ncbi:Hypothetical protein POVN_LOCUS63 [uncultured virus]|nr:Hypothetical protein POVN_LOCUS63 [uncultured virus]